jgi:hypothetical protein
VATKKLADAQEGDLARDTRTGIVYQLKNGEWVPLYREGQDISKYLIDRAIAGFVDLPFVPSRIREYFAKRAEQHAPPPGTWAHTAGGVAELAGGLLPFGSAWKWSAKGLTKLPWLRKAVTLPWSQGLPARAAVGAGAGVASDIATRGHKMSPEDIAYSALGGGLFGAIFPSAVGKKKLPPVVSTEGTPPAPTGGASDVQKVEESVAKAMEAVEGKTSGAVPETAPTPTSAPPPSPPAPPPLLEALPSQPWPPRLRYGSAFGNIGPSSETFPYLTRDDTVRLLEQIRRSTGAPIRPRPPVTPPFPPPPFQLPEVPRIRWGEGRGPLTAKEARKATSDLKKQLKGKRAVVIGGVPLLLDEDDIIHYYATQIASPE